MRYARQGVMDATTEKVWQRAREGHHTAVLGVGSLERAESGLCIVRIECDLHRSPLGAVMEARRRVDALLDDAPRPLLATVTAALRRRMLDEPPARDRGGALAVGVRRLKQLSSQRPVLLFQDLDAADDGSVRLLTELVTKPLDAAMIFLSRSTTPRREVPKLLSALQTTFGEQGVLVAGAPVSQAAEGPTPSLPELPYEVLRVLRAASVVGSSFEAAVVADLLGLDPVDVMELLQVASDAGVVLNDRGAGTFSIDQAVSDELTRQLLPSLASAWHGRLALLLGGEPHEEPPPPISPAGLEQPPTPRPVRGARGAQDVQDARAAQHAEAADDPDLAARRYASAAREAVSVGAYSQALSFADRALALLETQPAATHRRQLKIGILTEVARVQWEAAGDAAAFSLAGSLTSLDQCKVLLQPDDPVELAAEVAVLTAHVCYDLGDPASLERALAELHQAHQKLIEAGRLIPAAGLLNDEAAVWVRLGEDWRAADLLRRSRTVFGRFADADPVAESELAETDHLLARVSLKLAASRDDPTLLATGNEHAVAAEQVYRRRGMPRELARVWETLGRLERAAGHTEEAAASLTRAARAQVELRDVIGMARTSAALSELHADSGHWQKAIAALADSIALNLEKGSPQGLAFNRDSLAQIVGRLPPADKRQFEKELAAMEEKVERGLKELERHIAPIV